MANIRIVNIEVTGSALFSDNESYLNDLSATETSAISGGLAITPIISTTPIILPIVPIIPIPRPWRPIVL